MLDRFISYLQFGNTFSGIEYTLKHNEAIIYVTILKKIKQEVDIHTTFSSKSVEDVSKQLPKQQHVFLIINNDHILTKKLKHEAHNDDLKLVNKAFPNINLAEFYFEIIDQNDYYFISICRKKYVDELIKKYTDLGIYVVNFSLGNSIISNTISFVDIDAISTSNAVISFKNKTIETIDLNENIKEENYNINGLETSNYYILSLSGALAYVLNNYKPTTNFKNKLTELLNTFKQVRFFNQFFKTSLVFILVVLLINFAFFNYYFNKVNSLNSTSQLNQTTKSQIIKLNEDVSKSKKMTDDLLKSSASKSSFYVNSLVKSIPNSILLTEINYQPLMKSLKQDKGIELNQNTIILSGTSNDSEAYSKWVSTLETMTWIDKVEVNNYKDTKTSISSFSIKIIITT
ncbi:hypothetical protein MBM09_08275 [Flaviramulus sp. BrNp1-15]|uniref:PilN domain-containing protein n=1 Tax=Flaviramulus sp. BrNp1-15 TaxID=2916754 RepID=UPI001EE98198|nr:PilN domain-containing protein [Flaviramulus sp. BrNp1-15]ULC57915.1 hypothetical protein MBM09_08275 [Flaviramulus sp. BrNp1-15]